MENLWSDDFRVIFGRVSMGNPKGDGGEKGPKKSLTVLDLSTLARDVAFLTVCRHLFDIDPTPPVMTSMHCDATREQPVQRRETFPSIATNRRRPHQGVGSLPNWKAGQKKLRRA